MNQYIYLVRLNTLSMDYTSIPLPKILAERVKQAGPKEGYRTVTEFVIDATRRRLDELSD